jgi:ankyrin repeat protein
VKLLPHGHDLESSEEVSPAHYAAAAGANFEVLQAMTMMNLKIHQKDKDGALPLHYAARYRERRLSTSYSRTHPRREL